MHSSALQIVLWLSPLVIEIAMALMMLYRKLWLDLPIFFSYIVFEIGRTVFLFLERKNDYMYFYGYWVTEALGCLAALWVIKELFDNVFHRHLGLRKLGNVLFQWTLVVLLSTAVLMAWFSPGADVNRIMAGIFLVKRAVTFVQAGLLGFLFLFAFAFGLAWQHCAVGVALGFGVYGAVELAVIAVRTSYGRVANSIFIWLTMTVNNCCVLIWASYLLVPSAKAPPQPLKLENRLEEWNQALLLLLKR